MRTAPQLHRYAIEKGKDDNYWPEGCVDEWPVGQGTVENVGLVDRFEYQMKHAKDAKLMYVPRQRLGRGKEHFGGLD